MKPKKEERFRKVVKWEEKKGYCTSIANVCWCYVFSLPIGVYYLANQDIITYQR